MQNLADFWEQKFFFLFKNIVFLVFSISWIFCIFSEAVGQERGEKIQKRLSFKDLFYLVSKTWPLTTLTWDIFKGKIIMPQTLNVLLIAVIFLKTINLSKFYHVESKITLQFF